MNADIVLDLMRHSAARVVPRVIGPDPRQLFVSLTARCNNRCLGCHYGREFMQGHQLPLPLVESLLDDAKACGFERVRLYGGEPLLHRDLPSIVQHAVRLGLGVWLSTNGVLLESKIDALVAAGLRHLSVGLYGVGQAYDAYVQRPARFRRVEAGLAHVRARYGDTIQMHFDWLLMRPTCDMASLGATFTLAERYEMPICVNLIHYSLPYFAGREATDLQFRPEDRPALEALIAEILRFKARRPALVLNSAPGLRAVPDWLVNGPAMRVPCTSYRLIWVGPDGTVQMCYVKFRLGNLHEIRLRDMLFTHEHRKAAREAFALNCPNCHCGYDTRTVRHGPTLARHLGVLPWHKSIPPAARGPGGNASGTRSSCPASALHS